MRETSDGEGLVTLPEASAFLKVSRSTLYVLMASGDLPYVKIGKSRRVARAALVQLIHRHTQKGRIP
jgi:excisionase family DNA binding protein